MRCDGCGLDYDPMDGYAAFSFGWGETAIEQVQSHRRFAYCGACAKAIRAALGIPEPIPISEPPYSCADERLEFP